MAIKIADAILLSSVEDYLMLAVGNTGLDEQESAITVGQVKDYCDADKAQVAFTGSYLNLTDAPNLNDYVLMTTLHNNYYNKNQINTIISGVNGVKFDKVEELPDTGESNVIYLLPHEGGQDPDIFDEYVWLEDGQMFERIGSTSADFTNYYTIDEVNALIPSVGNGTITIQQGGVTKGTFTTNQSGNTTINLDAGGGSGSQVQADWNETDITDPAYILNKPEIPVVYDPVITFTQGGSTIGTIKLNQMEPSTIAIAATTQIQSDWTQSDNTAADYIKNKPTIPTVNNSTITLRQSGVVKGAFTLNQGSNQTIDLEIGGGSLQVQSNWTQTDTSAVDYIRNKPTLATVATSGDYDDLSNKPSTKTWVITYDNNTTETIQILYNPVI